MVGSSLALAPGDVTASLGVAGHEAGATPESLLEEADRALYRAKAAGGNAVA